jgi:AI-2 transport protein TqsA
MNTRTEGATGGQVLVAAAALVIIVMGLRMAASILVPFALALFLAILSLPLLLWLQTRGLPRPLAVLATLLVNLAVLGTFVLVISSSVNEFRLALPRYAVLFQERMDQLMERLQEMGVPMLPQLQDGLFTPEALFDIAGGIFRGLASLVTAAFVVFIIMIFILAEASAFPAKLRLVLGDRRSDLSRYRRVLSEVQQYVGIKTAVSLATGTLVGLWVWMLGLDFPLFWALLAFLFNYVPNVGSIIAALPAMLLAAIQLGVGPALVVGVGYLAINIVLGNFVEPMLMGRRLGLSTLVVILSLLFWGWTWGPVGMLLSLPLTMIVKIMLENTSDLRWVALLLGPAPASEEGVEPPLREAPLEG